jgi:hypothetical protein
MEKKSHSRNIRAKKLVLKPDKNWLRVRRELLLRIKTEVQNRLGEEPSDVKAFSHRHELEMNKRYRTSSKAELLSAIEHVNIVYGGDFHAHGPAQRTHLKILRELNPNRDVVLGLEAFPSRAQKWINQYLRGQLNLDELREKSRWDSVWGFPWENYRPLLELARKRGYSVLALNIAQGEQGSLNLRAREVHAASLIAGSYQRQKAGTLFYVIFGELHLVPEHLPHQVRKLCPKLVGKTHSPQDLVIFLNSERVYFNLAQRGLETSVDIVKFNKNQFCILSSPPWVQWQSYLLFLEKNHSPGLDWGEDQEDFDPTDQVINLIKLAKHDLGLEFKVNDLAVYASESHQVWRCLGSQSKLFDSRMASALIAAGIGFYIPASGTAYLAQSTVNHAAHLAGEYIHARLSGRQRTLWNLPRDFEALIWVEAVAFFISKLVNHKRSSQTIFDLRAEMALPDISSQGAEVLRLALDFRMSELIYLHQGRNRRVQVRPRQKLSYIKAARVLGGMMGERLYLAYRSRRLSLSRIVGLMRIDFKDQSFREDYFELARILDVKVGSGIDEGGHGTSIGNGTGFAVKTKKERL